MCKKTLLYEKHINLGAKMVHFAGWEMPVSYTNIIEEHNCVRNNVGLFDVSHMGEFFVRGKDSLAFLQSLVPQNIAKLADTKAVYCQLTNKNGGVVDDLIIYKIKKDEYLVIVNASGVETDFEWFLANKSGYDVELDNQSDKYSLLAVQGPKALNVIENMGLPKNEQPLFFSIKSATLCDIDVLISRTGYTGEDGFEILVKNDKIKELWDRVLECGKNFGIQPIGLGARDILRLEAALPLYGNDLTTNTTPVEAALSWSVDWGKEADYNGKNVLMAQFKNGVEKKIIGFKMLSKIPARHEYEVYYNGEKVGWVTSGVPSPSLKENIGLAYVKTSSNIDIGTRIQIMIRNKLYDAEVVKRPFVKKRNKV